LRTPPAPAAGVPGRLAVPLVLTMLDMTAPRQTRARFERA
jgi:hypothetical protein